MKFVFTFLIFLAVTSFTADLVCKVIDVSKTSKALSQSEEEDSEESQNEEGDTEGKLKLREFEYVPMDEMVNTPDFFAFHNFDFFIHLDNISDQHKGSVPFSPPEMS